MQSEEQFHSILNRPTVGQRYTDQNFYSAELLDTTCSAPKKENDLSQLRKMFEQNLDARKRQQQARFNDIPIEERMFFFFDKGSGQIYDTRNPNELQKFMDQQKNTQKTIQEEWEEFVGLSRKMNDYLLDMSQFGDEFTVRTIIESKDYYLDINYKGLDDWTALHHAAHEGHLNIIKILIEYGADIEAPSKLNRTPIFMAVINGHFEVVQFLLTLKVNVNNQDNDFNTPLHFASEQGFDRIVEALLIAKADPYMKNHQQKDSLQLSLNHQILQIFIKYGFQPKEADYDRTIIPGTTTLMKNSRYDHIMKLMQNNQLVNTNEQKEKEQKEQKEQKERDLKKKPSSKFQNLLKVNSIEIFNEKKLDPNSFHYYKLLGKGSFGEVYLAEKKNYDGRMYAIKVIRKDRMMQDNLLKYALTEKKVLQGIDHPFIVKLHHAFQTESRLFLALEYCPGGDLSHFLDIKRRLKEEEAKIYIAEIILALECLHKNSIIFRDLKPDNIVLDEDGHAMLTDFGLAKMNIQKEDVSSSFCGSPAYLAPEILNKQGHNRMADWYVLGVVAYEFLVGIPAYYCNDREQLFDNIRRGPLKMPRYLTPEAKHFIIQLLNRDPSKRLGYERDGDEIREHPWLSDLNWDDVYNRRLKPPKPTINQIDKTPLKVAFGEVNQERNRINEWTMIE